MKSPLEQAQEIQERIEKAKKGNLWLSGTEILISKELAKNLLETCEYNLNFANQWNKFRMVTSKILLMNKFKEENIQAISICKEILK